MPKSGRERRRRRQQRRELDRPRPPSRGDLRRLRTAIRAGWPIAQFRRLEIVQDVIRVLQADHAAVRHRIAAAATLIAMSEAGDLSADDLR
ncbi:MAG: hypothetical protein SFV23_21510 [Planctomycetaceae bacterium]|nr:hypothetical protein [Planctomycetaceae bacterium]